MPKQAKGNSSNTFKKGLNTDFHPLDAPNDLMIDNQNCRLITSEGNEMILQNEKGNEEITRLSPGFYPIAVKVYNNIAYIISRNFTNPNIGEVGTFPSPDWTILNATIPRITHNLSDKILSTTRTTIVEATSYDGITVQEFVNRHKDFEVTYTTQSVQLRGDPPYGIWYQTLFTNLSGSNPTYQGALFIVQPSDEILATRTSQFHFTNSQSSTGNPLDIEIASHQAQLDEGGSPTSAGWVPFPGSCSSLDLHAASCEVESTDSESADMSIVLSNLPGAVDVPSDNLIVTLDVDTTYVVDLVASNALSNGAIISATPSNQQGVPPYSIELVLDVSEIVGGEITLVMSSIDPLSTPTVVVTSVLSEDVVKKVVTYEFDTSFIDTKSTATFEVYNPITNEYVNLQYLVESGGGVDSLTPNSFINILGGVPPYTQQDLNIFGFLNTTNLFISFAYTSILPPNENQRFLLEVIVTYDDNIDGDFIAPITKVYRPLHNFYDEIGDIEDDASYTAPFRSIKMNAAATTFVDMELQPSYDNSMNVIFTDGVNPIKLVNSRFIVLPGNKFARLADRKGNKDSNIYSNERWSGTFLLFTSDTIAKVNWTGMISGGANLPGGYRFYFKYANSDLQTSGVFAESGLVNIFEGSGESAIGGVENVKIGKTPTFKLTGLDKKYTYVKMFYAHNFGQTEEDIFSLNEVVNFYTIDVNGESIIQLTGFEDHISHPPTLLLNELSPISTSATLTSIDNFLALGNIRTSITSMDVLTDITANVVVREQDATIESLDPERYEAASDYEKTVPYSNEDNIYEYVGYWNGETYELGIVYKLKETNTWTPAIPLTAIDNFEGGEHYGPVNINPDTGFNDDTSSTTFKYKQNIRGVYRTKEDKRYMKPGTLRQNLTTDEITQPYVTMLKVDINPLVNNARIRELTSGFYIVRKKRTKDTVYEGWLMHSGAFNLEDAAEAAKGAHWRGYTMGLGSLLSFDGDWEAVSTGPEKRNEVPAKYIPMPMRVLKSTNPISPSSADVKFTSYTHLTRSARGGTGDNYGFDLVSQLVMYTPDIVTDPLTVSSFFNGTNRGIRYANKLVYFNRLTWNSDGKNIYLFESDFANRNDNGVIHDGVLAFENAITYDQEEINASRLRWGYITSGRDTITPENFSAILFFQPRDRSSNSAEVGFKKKTVDIGVSNSDDGRIYLKFDDYIGLQLLDGDKGDLYNLFNRPSELEDSGGNLILGPIVTGDKDDIDNYAKSVGIQAGVLTRVYETKNGPLTMADAANLKNPNGQWQAKYSNTTIDGYFAVSHRYAWEEFEGVDAVSPILNLFNGDAYIGVHYKRITNVLGVPGDPTATNLTALQGAGAALEPLGSTMGVVAHSSTNFAIRSSDFKSEVERELYNNDRQFYPVYPEEDIAASQQLDSKLYYKGYNFERGAITRARQLIQSPAFVEEFPHRVMLSAASSQTSFYNGYRDFSGFNFRDYDSGYGQLMKLASIKTYLLAIYENGAGNIIIRDKTLVSDNDGGVFVNQALKMHPQLQTISDLHGTTYPYSIGVTYRAVYGVDWVDNKIWVINPEKGMNIISDFQVEAALKKVTQDLADNSAELYVEVGYDSFRSDVYFTYVALGGGQRSHLLTLVYNETFGRWVTKLSYSPYKIFNINENWYSFDLLEAIPNVMWEHESENVPFCNFYDQQDEFMIQFVVNATPEMQKMLNNLLIISNEVYPIKSEYIIQAKTGYELGAVSEKSFEEILTPRYIQVTANHLAATQGNTGFTFTTVSGLSVGDHIIVDGVDKYLVTNVQLTLVFESVRVSYLDPATNTLIPGIAKDYIANVSIATYYGIIGQNILYKEDHFYIQVGYSNTNEPNYSRPRDKYIKVRLTYKGDQQVFIQSIKSAFTYSFS